MLRWVDKYNEYSEIKRHNRKPVAIQDLLEKLKEKYPTLTLSRFLLNRIVNDNNITLKITRIRHEPNKRFGKDIDINKKIKELVNKHNNILYAVPYQHFTNSIENYFSMLKSRLQKLDGLTHEKLKENIEKYENILKETIK